MYTQTHTLFFFWNQILMRNKNKISDKCFIWSRFGLVWLGLIFIFIFIISIVLTTGFFFYICIVFFMNLYRFLITSKPISEPYFISRTNEFIQYKIIGQYDVITVYSTSFLNTYLTKWWLFIGCTVYNAFFHKLMM